MINYITSVFSRTASVVRAVLGVPDYDRYLSHMRTTHPGDRVMSETEFRHMRMNDRYNRAGSKCC
ncbi:MAG TPA: YbdD/YjiX family protein [Gemmatimonadaceae bacterium]|nr:YbdD/YjiX family protein [Gemmatimonadaceae bacterium]